MALALGAFLAARLNLDDERREVVTYGAIVLLHNGTTLVLMLLLAAVTGLVPETLAVLTATSGLRHATGGAHLATSWRCTGVTAITAWACAFLGRELGFILPGWPAPLALALVMVVTATGMAVIWRYAPVEAESRSLSPAHRLALRTLSIRLGLLFSSLLLIGTTWDFWWAGPGLLGFCLQVFTLTPAGVAWAHWIDSLLNTAQRR